ncbi:MAG: NAD(P)H-hydrate dehydratase [Verrucomicrobia bacterium]|nr:NAD(P)H-hydrate dehydratase [Verrucomicrobiota bacterium]
MIVSRAEMTALEEHVFATGSSAEVLMEKVGTAMAEWLLEHTPVRRGVLIFVGRGHNAGDGLVIARALHAAGCPVALRFAHAPERLAALTARMLLHVPGEVPRSVVGEGDLTKPCDQPPRVVIDALLGLNAKGALHIPERASAREINALRKTHAQIVAVDLPTGVDAETGAVDHDAVHAHDTLTVGFAKLGLVADSALNYVGRLHRMLHPSFTRAARELQIEFLAHEQLTDAAALAPLLRVRPFDLHKGHCGRLGLLAGSTGMTGAAVLAARGALRGGAGLIYLHVPPEVLPIVAASAPPEVMVRPCSDPRELLNHRFDALALGPGLGSAKAEAVREVIEQFGGPMVVDADALQCLAAGPSGTARLDHCAGPRLLTPHAGEMQRLFPEAKHHGRADTARRFTSRYEKTTLLYKGARTIVAQKGRPLAYNSTGTPGMATGGMGDVLTGLCGALLGQNYEAYTAARLGAWLTGRAAELCLRAGQSEESLGAGDMAAQLGAAFQELRR